MIINNAILVTDQGKNPDTPTHIHNTCIDTCTERGKRERDGEIKRERRYRERGERK